MRVFPAVLGWSNPDTGPVSMRLYALDQGDSPRWARPRARVVEDPLIEAGLSEGTRVSVVVGSPEQLPEEDLEITVRRKLHPSGLNVGMGAYTEVVHVPSGISVSVGSERSQLANKRVALAGLAAMLAEAKLDG